MRHLILAVCCVAAFLALAAERAAGETNAEKLIRAILVAATQPQAGAADSSAADRQECEDAPCEEGKACEDQPCEDVDQAGRAGDMPAAAAADAKPEGAEEEAEGEGGKLAYATHKQTKVISVNGGDLPRAQLRSFCLDPTGVILAACDSAGGEVRRFSGAGEYLDTWRLPMRPEAINVGEDGHVYVAGAGKIVKMTTAGEMLLEVDSPHTNASEEQREKVRQSVIKNAMDSVKRYKQTADRFAKRREDLTEAAATFTKNGLPLSKVQQQRIAQAEQLAEQWEMILKRMGGVDGTGKLSDEEVEKRVNDSLRNSMAVASISESAGDVFLATRETAGYGFCVWKLNSGLTEGEVIVKGLRGCCGQMDVQCCENGVYVAENSRKRVYHVSAEGKELGEWGFGARGGLEGFGSCCNPMNVAFGPGKSVYTAESGTGRIKRYTPKGELIELVGKVDIVPGCKKVSIAVGPSGDRVYMLDITRHHIVLMERLAPGEKSQYSEVRTARAQMPGVSG